MTKLEKAKAKQTKLREYQRLYKRKRRLDEEYKGREKLYRK